VCTYETILTSISGSAKGPGQPWFEVSRATVYFDHPVHAAADHTLNIDFADPTRGPGARVAVELDASSARALVETIVAVLDGTPTELVAHPVAPTSS
jgi:hypothetical protein